MVDIRQLRAFIAVAEELNFHRAAVRLGTVQPALSRIVQKLEVDMHVQLLERTTRHVRLTEAGKVFLAEAVALLNQLSGAVQATRDTAAGKTGSLTLAYMDFAVHRLLPDILKAVKVAEPGIRVDLTYMSTAQQRHALTDGRIDIGIMIGKMSGPRIDTMTVSEEPLMVVMPARHRLASAREVKLKNILGEPILLGTETEWSAFRQIILALYAEQGARPNIALEASSAAALFGLVAKGLGLAFYAGLPEIYQCKSLAFRPLADAPPLAIGLAWRIGDKLQLTTRFLKASGLGR